MNTANLVLQKIISSGLLGVSVNASTISRGEIFFALSKDQNKRIEAITKAFSTGACAAVTHSDDAQKISHPAVFFAEDLKPLLKQLLTKFYLPDGVCPTLAAVTGTNGKTSTAWYLAQILQQAGKPCACLGTTGGYVCGRSIPSRLTTPDVCEFYKFLHRAKTAGCQTVVFEYSSHALDQDRLLNPGIQLVTFTNLTPDHLDYHGTMENYFAAKRKLFTAHTLQGVENFAVINCDDNYGKTLLADTGIRRRKVSYGISPNADFCITEHYLSPHGTNFSACWQRQHVEFQTRLLGAPNILNISAACTNALLMGIPLMSLPTIVSQLTAVPGRFETVPNNRGLRIIIDYAHTPDALEKLLLNVRTITPGRVICVFGCGGNRDTNKRKLMGAIAEKYSQLPIVTSDNPRDEDPESIISQILSGMSDRTRALCIPCRRTAIQQALHNAARGDTVVIAGKGHETTQEIRGVFYPFSDREVVAELLEQTV